VVNLVLVIALAGCTGESATTSTADEFNEGDAARFNAGMARLETVPEPLRGSIMTWVNTHGLAQLDPVVWQARLDRTCDAQFWRNPLALRELTEEFLAADMALSIRDPAADPIDMTASYQALWVMALNNCRELVPVEVVRGSPPDFADP